MQEDVPSDEAGEVPDSFAELERVIADYEGQLIRYAARIVNNYDAAQDIVQTTFIKLSRAWSTGTRQSPELSAWLFRVTHNAAVDHIRAEARRHALMAKHTEQEESDLSSRDTGISETAEKASAMLKRLSLREQQLVILKVYEGKTYREISNITGLTIGNVGFILHHAMKKLAKLVNGVPRSGE